MGEEKNAPATERRLARDRHRRPVSRLRPSLLKALGEGLSQYQAAECPIPFMNRKFFLATVVVLVLGIAFALCARSMFVEVGKAAAEVNKTVQSFSSVIKSLPAGSMTLPAKNVSLS